MTRVAIYLADLYRKRTDSHGIINYAIGLTSAIARALKPEDEFIIFSNEEIQRELPVGLNGHVITFPTPATYVQRILNDEVRLPHAIMKCRPDILHLPKGMTPLRRLPSVVQCVPTVHDDIPFDLVATGRLGSLKIMAVRRSLKRSLHRCEIVLTDSHHSASRLLTRVGRPGRVDVVHPGLDLRAERVDASDKKPRAIIFSSSLAHKRFRETAEAVRPILHDRGMSLCAIGDESAAIGLVDEFIGSGLSTSNVHRSIAESKLLVFGSSSEGFGLPPLEAWGLGTPALVSDLPPMNSLLADYPGLFRDSVGSMEGAMDQLLGLDSFELKRLSDQVLDRYSWLNVSSQLAALYSEITAGRVG